jgi:hypothetical protein
VVVHSDARENNLGEYVLRHLGEDMAKQLSGLDDPDVAEGHSPDDTEQLSGSPGTPLQRSLHLRRSLSVRRCICKEVWQAGDEFFGKNCQCGAHCRHCGKPQNDNKNEYKQISPNLQLHSLAGPQSAILYARECNGCGEQVHFEGAPVGIYIFNKKHAFTHEFLWDYWDALYEEKKSMGDLDKSLTRKYCWLRTGGLVPNKCHVLAEAVKDFQRKQVAPPKTDFQCPLCKECKNIFVVMDAVTAGQQNDRFFVEKHSFEEDAVRLRPGLKGPADYVLIPPREPRALLLKLARISAAKERKYKGATVKDCRALYDMVNKIQHWHKADKKVDKDDVIDVEYYDENLRISPVLKADCLESCDEGGELKVNVYREAGGYPLFCLVPLLDHIFDRHVQVSEIRDEPVPVRVTVPNGKKRYLFGNKLFTNNSFQPGSDSDSTLHVVHPVFSCSPPDAQVSFKESGGWRSFVQTIAGAGVMCTATQGKSAEFFEILKELGKQGKKKLLHHERNFLANNLPCLVTLCWTKIPECIKPVLMFMADRTKHFSDESNKGGELPPLMEVEADADRAAGCFFPGRRTQRNFTFHNDRTRTCDAQCKKLSPKKEDLSAGVMMFCCPHRYVFGGFLMGMHESPESAFRVILNRFTDEELKKMVFIYDNACNAQLYGCKRFPKAIQHIRFHMDRLHEKCHCSSCTRTYKISSFPQFKWINTQACEQYNNELKGLRGILKGANSTLAIEILQEFSWRLNNSQRLKRLKRSRKRKRDGEGAIHPPESCKRKRLGEGAGHLPEICDGAEERAQVVVQV